MTPEQLAALRAVVLIIETIGSWPVLSLLLLIVVGPWVGLWVYAAGQSKRETAQKEQFDAMVNMYNNNVELVKAYDKAMNRWERHADDLSGIIHLNTQMSTKLVERIDNNMYCPALRERN